MTTTYAARNRPFTSPHAITKIKKEVAQLKESRFAERAKRIDDLVSSAPSDNKDRMYWSMVYDLEEAPTCTARQMILEYGIIPVPPHELSSLSDMHDELWAIIEALSKCGVYLLNTNHMCDRDLYCRLYYKILDEECRMMPPAAEAAEFIDCLHPLDLDYPLGKQLPTLAGAPEPGASSTYTRGPQYNVIGQLCDRDQYLPKPW